MCAQRAGDPPAGVLVWDYHVVTLTKLNDTWTVLDPDHIPSAVVPLSDYLRSSFEPFDAAPSQYLPQFKLIEASYLKIHFASDRRHMRSADGGWLKHHHRGRASAQVITSTNSSMSRTPSMPQPSISARFKRLSFWRNCRIADVAQGMTPREGCGCAAFGENRGTGRRPVRSS